jgi:pilus assembly protein CpaE
MTADLRQLKAFADEAAAASPETLLAAAFRPDVFGPDVSESAILIEALRAGVRDFLRRPLSRADLEQLLDRPDPRTHAAPARFGRVLSFVSNKGGVGKSTLAVNVACGLAGRAPDRVLLIDASLQLGTCASLLDLHPAASLTDAARERDRLDEVLLRQFATRHACGLHLLAAPASAVEATAIDDEVMARVLTLARRAYDYVLVDTFPMLDRVVMAVLDLSDLIYVVLESVVPTLLGAARLVELLDGLGLPSERQRVVLNRYSNFAGNLRPADVAERLGRRVDYLVPYQKKLVIAANVGRPFVLGAHTWFGLGKALRRMVEDIVKLAPAPAGRLSENGRPAGGQPARRE